MLKDAGYDLRMMKQGSGLGEKMDPAIKYKVNIGGSGKFDVNLIIAEYWADGRDFGIKIAGK